MKATERKISVKNCYKIFAVIEIVLMFIFVFSSCGGKEIDDFEKEQTPIELLTEKEKMLFEAVIKMSKDFFEPSGVKILEVGEYHEANHYVYAKTSNEDKLGDGLFNLVTVRIQGENRIGGTLSHYYLIRLDTLKETIVDNPQQKQQKIEERAESDCISRWDNRGEDEYPKTDFGSRQQYKIFLINSYYAGWYCTQEEADQNFGRYIELDDKEIEESNEDIFDVSKINKALKYYWDERLGNS